MAKYQVGDQVQLKSGGPAMTAGPYRGITSAMKSDTLLCTWFVGNKSNKDFFHEDALQPYTAPPAKVA